jgi:hypothetical protein
MASRRDDVRLPGVLWAGGHEATCVVSATRVSLLGLSAVAYRNYSIEQVSKDLPEGSYQLSVNGEIIPMRHHNGQWPAALIG